MCRRTADGSTIQSYRTEEAARIGLLTTQRFFKRSERRKAYAYQCPVCQCWHITTREMKMTDKALTTKPSSDIMERVLLAGDLVRLTPQERVTYYGKVCESVGLNPLTKPFDYLSLNGKLVLYANRSCSEQLRKINGVSIERLERELTEDVYVVIAYAKDDKGRTDSSLGAVPIAGLKGEIKANAMMKAETKAKRRVTLSICGLGWLDETEVDSIPGAQRVDAATVEAEPPAPKAEPKKIAAPSGGVKLVDMPGPSPAHAAQVAQVTMPKQTVAELAAQVAAERQQKALTPEVVAPESVADPGGKSYVRDPSMTQPPEPVWEGEKPAARVVAEPGVSQPTPPDDGQPMPAVDVTGPESGKINDDTKSAVYRGVTQTNKRLGKPGIAQNKILELFPDARPIHLWTQAEGEKLLKAFQEMTAHLGAA